jgi:hypothetical protein
LTGWLTVTVVAVTGRPKKDVEVDDPVAVGVPNAFTQTPAITADAVEVMVLVKTVDEL